MKLQYHWADFHSLMYYPFNVLFNSVWRIYFCVLPGYWSVISFLFIVSMSSSKVIWSGFALLGDFITDSVCLLAISMLIFLCYHDSVFGRLYGFLGMCFLVVLYDPLHCCSISCKVSLIFWFKFLIILSFFQTERFVNFNLKTQFWWSLLLFYYFYFTYFCSDVC